MSKSRRSGGSFPPCKYKSVPIADRGRGSNTKILWTSQMEAPFSFACVRVRRAVKCKIQINVQHIGYRRGDAPPMPSLGQERLGMRQWDDRRDRDSDRHNILSGGCSKIWGKAERTLSRPFSLYEISCTRPQARSVPLLYTDLSKKTSTRLRELAPNSVASSRNLAGVFLDILVFFLHSILYAVYYKRSPICASLSSFVAWPENYVWREWEKADTIMP